MGQEFRDKARAMFASAAENVAEQIRLLREAIRDAERDAHEYRDLRREYRSLRLEAEEALDGRFDLDLEIAERHAAILVPGRSRTETSGGEEKKTPDGTGGAGEEAAC